jgi:hypothetical protein
VLACTGELLNLLWVLFICMKHPYVRCGAHAYAGFGSVFHDVKLAWLGAIFLLVGGGQFLLAAMLNLIIADVIKDSRRYYLIHIPLSNAHT